MYNIQNYPVTRAEQEAYAEEYVALFFSDDHYPIITEDLDDWDWTDDRAVQTQDTNTEEQAETHHLRYKEGT